MKKWSNINRICACLIVLVMAVSSFGGVCFGAESEIVPTLKAFHATTGAGSFADGRWTVSGTEKWSYLSIEFTVPEREYTEEEWFSFTFYYRVNTAKTDPQVTILPNYFSASGYVEETDRYFDLARGDREPYFAEGEWRRVYYCIPMKSAKTRSTVRTWLTAGISGDSEETYSIDFKDPVCRYLGKPEAKTASEVSMTELPQTSLFETEGSFHDLYSYQRWMQEGTTGVIVKGMLENNIAFVKGSDWYWDGIARRKTTNCVTEEAGELKIRYDLANSLFGTSFAEGYVSADEITEVQAEWESFYDPRGFLLFSKMMSAAIDLRPSPEGGQYRSYFDVSAAMGEITYSNITPTAQDWQKARERYLSALTFPTGMAAEYADEVSTAVSAAETLLAAMDQTEGETLPFPNAALSVNIPNVLTMAKGYAMLKRAEGESDRTAALAEGSLMALEKVFAVAVGQNIALDSNWVQNIVSYPQVLAKAMMCLYDVLPEEKREEYLNILFLRTGEPMVTTYCVPYRNTFYASGDMYNAQCNYTNLLWGSLTIYQLCLLAENTSRMNHTLRYINQIFEETSNAAELAMAQNGFYEDGSFLFHGVYPYNLGYGASYISGLCDWVVVGAGTPFDIRRIHGFDKTYDRIDKAYFPFIYDNSKLKIVQGRETPFGESAYATSVVLSLLMLAKYSEDDGIIADTLTAAAPIIQGAKRTYQNVSDLSGFNILTLPTVEAETADLITDALAMTATEEPYHYQYYNMDKAVHKRDNFTFLLSMSSERVDKYEAINDHGYLDWYIADGMTYLMMNNGQYTQRWWNFVDRYEMPGTTVDSAERAFYSSTSGVYPNNSRAGGVTDGVIGASAMELPTVAAGKTSYVEGKKSWFMLEDKIICLGTGISGGAGEVYTTVENYISYEKDASGVNHGYVSAFVDEAAFPYTFDSPQTYDNPSAVWFADRGYVFLGDQQVSVKRAKESKRICGIFTSGNSGGGTFPFLTVRVEHGENPTDSRYGYVILPGKSYEETMAYAADPDIAILRQDDTVHAVKLADGTVLANLFAPAAIEGITFDTPCSVILRPTAYGVRVYLSDPTHKEERVGLLWEGGEEAVAVGDIPGRTVFFDIISSYAIEAGEELTISLPEAAEVTVLAPVYQSGLLQRVYIKELALESGIHTVDPFWQASDEEEIKFMLWQDMGDIRPLAQSDSR